MLEMYGMSSGPVKWMKSGENGSRCSMGRQFCFRRTSDFAGTYIYIEHDYYVNYYESGEIGSPAKTKSAHVRNTVVGILAKIRSAG